MKSPAKILAALALAAGLVSVATPAHATGQTEPKPICTTWQARLVAVDEEGVHTTPGGASNISEGSVTLTRPNATTGTEFLARVDIDGPAVVKVDADYDGDKHLSGAIRLFGYASATVDPADAAAPGPTYGPAIAPAELTFTVAAGQHLGTIGLTWDSSNEQTGPVVFADLLVGNRPVPFKACPVPASPSATPTPTKTATAKPSASASATTAVPVLPKTPGASSDTLTLIASVGGGLLVLGVAGYFLARRRRTRFAA